MYEKNLQEIKKISELSQEEVCGFWVKGRNAIIQCENVAINKKDNFEISSEKYIETFRKKHILLIFHSHPESSEKFSKQDIKLAEEISKAILVYSKKSKKFNIFIPEELKKNKILINIEKSVVNY